MIKHKSWEYEDEYRIILPYEYDGERGMLCYLKSIGLEIKNIYLGMSCEKEYIDKIKHDSKEKGYGVKQMYFDDNVDEFTLKYKNI